jgi:holo-[acyl-carrier protein] synthase
MILGLGIDLVSISKIAESVNSESFQGKVFTPSEIEFCESFANPAEHYAGKFAAKEAFMKAIGKGIRQEVWFTQIEVLNGETGAPYVQVSGEAERTLSSLGVEIVHISISHTMDMAVAVIILEASQT